MKTPTSELSLGIETLEALDAPKNGEGVRAFFVGVAIGLAIVVVIT